MYSKVRMTLAVCVIQMHMKFPEHTNSPPRTKTELTTEPHRERVTSSSHPRSLQYYPPFYALLHQITSFHAAFHAVRGCTLKFPDWRPGVRTANGIALCHQVQLYRYFV